MLCHSGPTPLFKLLLLNCSQGDASEFVLIPFYTPMFFVPSVQTSFSSKLPQFFTIQRQVPVYKYLSRCILPIPMSYTGNWHRPTTGHLPVDRGQSRHGAATNRLESVHESSSSQRPPALRQRQSNYGTSQYQNTAPRRNTRGSTYRGSTWDPDRPEVIYDDRKDSLRRNEFKRGSESQFWVIAASIPQMKC